MAGGLMEIGSMAQVIGPLSRERQVIGIDLEGHGRTALRNTPMSHQRNGDDVAAVFAGVNPRPRGRDACSPFLRFASAPPK